MKIEIQAAEDAPVWDVWLSTFWLPSLVLADELGIFLELQKKAATAQDLAPLVHCSVRGLAALLPMLASLGFLACRAGKYGLSEVSRSYLLPDSPAYWGGTLSTSRNGSTYEFVKRGLAEEDTALDSAAPAVGWAAGQISLAQARSISSYMNGHSMAAALGFARAGILDGTRRMLDVGGGSGCFSIAAAERHPALRCTIMDLPAVCTIALEYVAEAGMADRVDTVSVDMFRAAWPHGYDAIFLSNVFHDWSFETCAGLARSAYAALPPGGRILLHEMLFDDSGAGPRHTAAFSMMMLGTEGQQFTFAQLRDLLQAAGFSQISVLAAYGRFSVVTGVK